MVDGRNLDSGGGAADERDDEHLGDDIVELALGTVDGDRRARMAAHVLRCAACRREYDELAATVAALGPAVPGVQPPIGFDERVLARFATDHAPPSRRRRPQRWGWLAAAAVFVALLVPAGIWLASRDDSDQVAVGSVATLERTKDGTAVGTVSISDVEGTSVMVVALVGAPDDVSYYCRIQFADGRTIESGSWPAGNGAWVVPLDTDGAAVTSVAVLPEGTEKVWSAATFQ